MRFLEAGSARLYSRSRAISSDRFSSVILFSPPADIVG